MQNRLKARCILVFVAMLGAGCATSPIERVKSVEAGVDERSALVAFSVVNAPAFAINRLELVAASGSQDSARAKQVPVDWKGVEAQVFVYRVPANGAQFGPVRFVFQGEWWETRDPGPEFTVVPGQLTYLGRLQPYSIQVDRYVDSGRGYPAAVRIRVLDARDDDLARLVNENVLSPDMPVVGAIPDSWGGAEFVELDYRPIPGRLDRNTFWDMYGRGPVPAGPELPAPKPKQR